MSAPAFHDALAQFLCGAASAVAPRDGDALAGIDRSRLDVHRNTFVVTLIEAMAETFPVTQALVGSNAFRAMARACVLAEPPRTPVLTEYLQAFPDFVRSWPPMAAFGFVQDMAVLEALQLRAFHAADAEPAAPAAFAALLAEPARLCNVRVELQPAAAWFRSQHPLHALWMAHPPGDAASADLSAIDADARQDVLVLRVGFEVRVHALPEGAIAFLDALRDGRALADAVRAAQEDAPAADAEVLLGLLVSGGLVVALREPGLRAAPAQTCSPCQAEDA